MNGAAPDDLASRLEAHANFFDDKLALIPPKVYWAGPSDPNAYEKAQARSRGETQPKKKKAKKARKEHRRPTEAQLSKFRQRATLPQLIEQGKFGTKPLADADENNSVLTRKEPSREAVAAESQEAPSPKAAATSHMLEIKEKLGFVPGSAVKSPAELQERMRLLREWYKTKSKRPAEDEADSTRIEKKRARQLKKQADKLKRKTSKQQRADSDLVAASSADAAKKADKETQVEKEKEGEAPAAIDFNKFKFSSGKAEPLYKERGKRGRDVELLRKAEAEQAKKRELMQTEDGMKEVKEMEWDKMIAKAEGAKVRDDPLLLKKSIKKREKKKAKSQATWAEKAKSNEERKKEKQADFLRRQEKTLNRRKSKKSAAAAAAPLTRKGRRAGFEGRKKLNKK